MSEEQELYAAYDVRSWYCAVHEILHDGGKPGDPLLKAAAAVVIRNPFAGRYVADLSPLTRSSALLGRALGARAVALLGGREEVGHALLDAVPIPALDEDRAG